MSAARVDIVLGWRAGGTGGRCYVRRLDAYYQVAKKLVVAKYPAALTRSVDGPGDDERFELRDYGLTDVEIDARYARARVLFCRLCYPDEGDNSGAYFDENKWRKFVRRVARFLMFVDDRTHRSHVHEQYERAMEAAGRGAEAYRYRKDDPR